MTSGYSPTNNRTNIRTMREIHSNEHAGYVALIQAIAQRQDKSPPPQPAEGRA
jgi:hypothetical protein